MAYPTRYYRLYNFLQDQLRGLTFNNGKLDAELSALQVTVDQLNTRLRGITTADGSLTNVAAPTALALAGAQRFVATASQTDFTTTIAWDSTFSASSVVCFTGGSRIDSNSVTVSNAAGFLKVVLPAQTLSAIVIINAYQPGTVAAAASTITVADVAGYYVAANVEDVLAEIQSGATYGIRTLIAALPGGSIAGLASFLLKDGTRAMTGDLNMSGGSGGGYVSANGHKVVGLKGGSQAGDAVEWSQFAAFTTVWNNLSNYFLKLDGTTTMAGSLNMGNQAITNLKNADLSDATQATNVGTVRSLISSNGGLPAGTVADYAGTTVPSGWLLCDGSEVSQTTYSSLFASIGSTYGAATAGNFRVPDCRGRMTVGLGTGTGEGTSGTGLVTGGTTLTARALSAWGGEETHAITVGELPAHHHTVNGNDGGPGAGMSVHFATHAAPSPQTSDTADTGSNTPHNTMAPYIVFNKIIKF